MTAGRNGGRAVLTVALLTALPSYRLTAQAAHPEGPRPPGAQWNVHSWSRPRPPVVDPGPERPSVPPPADAVVLFGGRDLSEWQMQRDSSAAKWIIRDGAMEVVPGTGSMMTRRSFGDIQLHIEYSCPTPPHGESQERGNSGVFLMTHYEVQVLDSYDNDTYPDGQAGAIYGQTPPLVNPVRPPGQWNVYDIVFHRPHFGADGNVTQPARITVFMNGILIQDNTTITGWTVNMQVARYQPHADRLPLALQDHQNPTRFRNVWVRELPE